MATSTESWRGDVFLEAEEDHLYRDGPQIGDSSTFSNAGGIE
jgi:hypothetical protein